MTKSKTSWLAASALTIGALSMSFTAFARSSDSYKTTINTPIEMGQSVKINVVLSDELAYRANNLSPKLSDRNGVRSLNDGFAGRGKYGEKSLSRLTDRLEKKITKELTKDGITVSDSAPYTLNLVVADADSTRPTFEQLSSSSGLSFQSYGLGGASLEGTLLSGDQEIGSMSYAWYESNIRDSAYGSTWSDAYRAIDRFARKTADTVSGDS